MPNTSITFGILLILVGLIGFAVGMMDGGAHVTALIPAFIGIVLTALGFAAGAKENLRKHLMHAAVVIALLGFIAMAGRVFSKMSDLTMTAGMISTIVTGAICLVFVILAVRSFAKSKAEARP